MADYVHVPAGVKRYIHNFDIESHRESKWPRHEEPAVVTMRRFRDSDVVSFTPDEARAFAFHMGCQLGPARIVEP